MDDEITFEIRFIDTLAFLPSSLDNLSKNLKSECDNNVDKLRKTFKNVSKQFKDDVEFLLMTEKGVYPYEYVNDYTVLSDCKLPSIEKFDSFLNDSKCDPKDYVKAQNVWNTFNCEILLYYHNMMFFFLQTVGKISNKFASNDVSYDYTSPGLSWDAFLKHAREEYKKDPKK